MLDRDSGSFYFPAVDIWVYEVLVILVVTAVRIFLVPNFSFTPHTGVGVIVSHLLVSAVVWAVFYNLIFELSTVMVLFEMKPVPPRWENNRCADLVILSDI